MHYTDQGHHVTRRLVAALGKVRVELCNVVEINLEGVVVHQQG